MKDVMRGLVIVAACGVTALRTNLVDTMSTDNMWSSYRQHLRDRKKENKLLQCKE